MPTERELDEYLDTLLKHRTDRFTEWEHEFLRSLRMWRTQNHPYTERQAAKLDQIADKLLN